MEAEPTPPGLTWTPPERGTPACLAFYETYGDLLGFILFITALADRADEAVRTAATALLDTDRPGESSDAKRERWRQAAEAEEGAAIRTFREYRLFILDTLVSRGVDNFLTYLSGMLRIVFRERPETLRSGEDVRLDFVLGHASMEDLIETLADRRVDRLAFAGVQRLSEYLGKMGLELFADEHELNRAVRVVEERNLIVHNRGHVNRRFLDRVPGTPLRVGERIDYSDQSVFDEIAFLAGVVRRVDAESVRKWGLDTVSMDDQVATPFGRPGT